MNFLKDKRDRLKSQMKDQKGLTMIELMFVLLVIAIIIGVVVGIGNNSADKARETGVRSDLKNFTDVSELYISGEVGKGITGSFLAEELDRAGIMSRKDPWKNTYNVVVEGDDAGYAKVVTTSNGKDGNLSKVKDNYIGTSYYYDGKTARCTTGFNKNEVDTIEETFGAQEADFVCGADLKGITGSADLGAVEVVTP